MLKLKKSTSLLFVSLFAIWFETGVVFSQDFQAKSSSVPAPQRVTTTLIEKSRAMSQDEFDAKEANLREHHLPGPISEVSEEVMLLAPPPAVLETNISPAPRATFFFDKPGADRCGNK